MSQAAENTGKCAIRHSFQQKAERVRFPPPPLVSLAPLLDFCPYPDIRAVPDPTAAWPGIFPGPPAVGVRCAASIFYLFVIT